MPEVSKTPKFLEELRKGDLNADSLLRIETEQELIRRYRDQLVKPYRNDFDFDVWITVREYEGRLYLIPSCGLGAQGCLDFLKRDRRLEDFAFWDNSDKPNHITGRAWRHRKRVWDALDPGVPGHQLYADPWSDYLTIEINSYSTFWKTKPNFKL